MHSRNGTDFFDLPVQCKITALESGNLWIPDILASGRTENNPQKVAEEAIPDLPLFQFSDEVMSLALTSTAKKDKKDKKNKSGGDSDGCQWGDGSPQCVVESLPAVDDIPGFVDASQSGDGLLQVDSSLKISTNITPRTLSEEDCNFLLNHLFGSAGSVAASAHEPKGLVGIKGGKNALAGLDRSNTEFAGNIHVYGDAAGAKTGSPLYIPVNLNGSAPSYLTSYTGESDFSDKPVTFISGQYTDSSGGYSNRFIFQYNNGLTILAAHVAGGYGGKSGGNSIGREFMRGGRLAGPRNLAGSYQIGFIGGPGGDNGQGYYIHTHVAFWRNGKKINPRTEFCGGGSKF